MTAPAGEMGDDEILGLADALIAIHLQVVRNKGLDLSEIASPEKEEMVRGRIISVIRPCFGCVFGQSPPNGMVISSTKYLFSPNISQRTIFSRTATSELRSSRASLFWSDLILRSRRWTRAILRRMKRTRPFRDS